MKGWWLIGLLTLLLACAPLTPSVPGPSAEEGRDPRPLYQALLGWAVLGIPLPGGGTRLSFPDQNLLQGEPVIRIVQENLPTGLNLSLPGREVQILPAEELQRLAEREGEVWALHFTPFTPAPEGGDLGVDLVWFVPADVPALLAGGGVRFRFRWQEGSWRVERLLSLWIS